MNVQPLGERVIVKPVEPDEKVGMILVPDAAKEKPMEGIVQAVGTDEELLEYINEGDRIMFGMYAGEEIEVDGEKYLIVSLSDILAKYKPRDPIQ